MAKKIIFLFVLMLCMFGITSVEAASESKFIDMQTYTNIYKLSEDSEVTLPFIKFFNERAYFDKKIDKSGIIFAANAVEIKDEMDGLQTIISSDTVDIKGSVEYAAILASNVVISGIVEKDIFVFAQSVFVTETANILGDIIVISDTVEMKGNVQGNFIGNATEFMMAGKVEKDFRVYSQKMTFEETDIKGDIYIETESNLNISEQYENSVVKKIQSNVVSKAERKNQIIKTVMKILTAVLLFTLLNMIVNKIKPEMFKNLGTKVVAHSSFAIVMGVLLLATIPIVTLLAFICSLVGLGVVTTPLFVVYVAMAVVIIALAKFIVGSVIFELLKNKLKINSQLKEIGLLLITFALLHIICYIPFIAWFATMAIVLLSSGIVVTGLLKKQ